MTKNLIAVAQINVHVGNFESNFSRIAEYINKAKEKKADIVVFPELAVCGYPPRDFLEYSGFAEKCLKYVHELAVLATDIHVIVGCPSKNETGKGKALFNSAFLLGTGKVLGVVHKSLLPTYDIFDEYRYFEPNPDFKVFDINGEKIGIAICEDLWNTESKQLYQLDPARELAALGAETVINIAASPFHSKQHKERLEVLKECVTQYSFNLIYCNHVGAQTELIFDGGSLVMDRSGEVLNQSQFYKEGLIFSNEQRLVKDELNKVGRVHAALVLGIQDYFKKLGFKKALVGLSGGIDSAVCFAIACDALGSDNVQGILMPSQYSSDHSIKDAEDLATNLGAGQNLIGIEGIYRGFEKALSEVFEGTDQGLAEENLQARIRGTLLMAYSNKHGNILLNTSNKSEAAVGYGTLYGDMNGGLSVLGDLYKTEVYELARYINRNGVVIPINTVEKPPSAELRPDQLDSDSLPDYDLLDQVLYQYIEQQLSLEQISVEGMDQEEISRVVGLVNLNEYKRYQTPPTLRVSTKAFGMGRRMPIVAKY